MPEETTVENWYSKVGSQFLFAVKASRMITHYQKLVNIDGSLKLVLGRMKLLKKKLGPILYQLPSSLKKDYKLLKKFLNKLPKRLRQVVEFRDKSWIDKEIFGALRGRNIAYCIISMSEFPVVLEITADFTYIRMHGSSSLYGSCYQKDELRGWALRIKDFLASGKDTYIYSNNDVQGYAVTNAQSLKNY